MDLARFLQEYTDAVYHAADPEAAGRFIADPCVRHEHGHQLVMSLAENKARIAGFLARATNPRFTNSIVLEQGDLLASAYEFSFGPDDNRVTMSGIEIFKIRDGKIAETWNPAAGEGPWG
ncbi:MAG: nuclear transport factor 2 family protein [Dehalococcoidia bacterium]